MDKDASICSRQSRGAVWLRRRKYLAIRLLVIAAWASAIVGVTTQSHSSAWAPPERLTMNGVEDLAAPGSLATGPGGHPFAVWQQGNPGRVLFSERSLDWLEPVEIDPSEGSGSGARVTADSSGNVHVVWQHGVGDSSEVIYAHRQVGMGWEVEDLTENSTPDVSPSIVCDKNGSPHIAWLSRDTATDSVKVTYASGLMKWQAETVPGSDTQLFLQAPAIDVDSSGVVHVAYIQFDPSGSHAHYARRELDGQWRTDLLTSLNANDYTTDLDVESGVIHLAMSGHDVIASPWRAYYRRSTDGGINFDPAELASGSFLYQLDDLDADPVGNVVLVGSEVEGTFYTENLVMSRLRQAWNSELIPPADRASRLPSVAIMSEGVGEGGSQRLAVLYSSRGRRVAGVDSTEIYFAVHGDPTPVLITGFTGSLSDDGVTLEWRADRSMSVLGFNVLRTDSKHSPAIRINDAPVESSESDAYYHYDDRSVEVGREYLYWLEELHRSGENERYGPLSVRVARSVGTTNSPLVVRPNPMLGTASIEFEMSKSGMARMKVYDVEGRLRRSLLRHSLPVGRHAILWDGQDDSRHELAQGIYFVVLESPQRSESIKVTVRRQ